MIKHLVLALALALALPSSALAQDGPALGFSLGGTVSSVPDYFGSEDSTTVFAPSLGIGYLRLGGLELGSPDYRTPRTGFSFGPSLRVIKERDASEYPELAGLSDIDTAVELGVELRYRTENWQAFGTLRQGFGGHEGTVGELGADLLLHPNDKLTLRAGPRAFFGNDDFAATYFGVTAIEAASSSFNQFDAAGGLLSSGVEVGANYRINDNWELDGAIRFNKWQNDAADSPISETDSDLRATIGFTRHFRLGF